MYAPSPMAVPGEVTFDCLNSDRIFVERYFGQSPSINPAYDMAADACRKFKNHFRTGIDGNKVTYDKFYEGEAQDFLNRVFLYVAEKLRKLSEDDREEDQYTCHISPEPLTMYMEEIEKLI